MTKNKNKIKTKQEEPPWISDYLSVRDYIKSALNYVWFSCVDELASLMGLIDE